MAIVRNNASVQAHGTVENHSAPLAPSQQPTSEPLRHGMQTEASGDEVAELDRIVVTGTRIRGQTGSAPVYTFDQEDFSAAGASSVQQVLRTLPQNFTGGSSETASAVVSTRNGSEYNVAYGAGVNLRGLGTESTLILLNGRRLAPGGFGNFTDMSLVPLGALKRIEVRSEGHTSELQSLLRSSYAAFFLTKKHHP